MNEIEQRAFLLHARPYQDHNCIVELLTEFDGKVSAIAYIGKGNKSNKKALLQPFRPLNVLLKGRNALKNLSRVEANQKSLNISGDSLFSGFYLNELLVRLLTEQHPCDELFHHYRQSLQALTTSQPLEKILRCFEMTLLTELGVLFDFSKLNEFSLLKQQDEQGFTLDTHVELVCFSAELGFIPVLNKQQLPCYTATYSVNHLLAIADQCLDNAAVMYTYKRLMRQIINGLLGNKPLNSRKLFK
ncbi:MAG: DNA repair protein RecO [Alteromonadaceae bacterium]|nr:DNA repair protein RecO [Alteromonadaceae bacterium]